MPTPQLLLAMVSVLDQRREVNPRLHLWKVDPQHGMDAQDASIGLQHLAGSIPENEASANFRTLSRNHLGSVQDATTCQPGHAVITLTPTRLASAGGLRSLGGSQLTEYANQA